LERTVNSKGRIVDKSRKFYGWVKTPDGKRVAVPLATDRATSLQILARKAKLAERQSEGLSATQANEPGQPLAPLAEEWLAEIRVNKSIAQERNFRPRLYRLLELCRFQKVADFQGSHVAKLVDAALAKLGMDKPRVLGPGDKFTTTEVRTILEITQVSMWALSRSLGISGTGNARGKWFTREEAQRFLTHRGRGKSVKTLNDHVLALRMFCRWLKARGTIEAMPDLPKLADPTKARRHIRRALTAAEVEKLAQAVEDQGLTLSWINPQSRAILYRVAFWSLARSRALRELKVSDLTLKGPRPFLSIRSETDKTRTSRAIPLPPELAKSIGRMVRGLGPDALVFPFDFRTIASAVRADLRLAGIPYRTNDGVFDFHAFRHSGTSHYFAAGLDSAVICRLGGWSKTDQIIRTYGHLSPGNLADLIGRAWG